MKENQEIDFTKGCTESDWPFIRFPAGILHAWNYYCTVSAVSSLRLWFHLKEMFALGLKLILAKCDLHQKSVETIK